MDKDCKITLHYFNAKGRGEIIRYILAYTKKDFTDHRIEKEDWPALKPQMPLGQLPVLEFTNKDGKSTMLCQSGALIRHTALLFDLAGKTPEQKARADEAFESLREVMELGARVHFHETDPAKKEELIKHLKTELAPRIFGLLEKRAVENGGKNIAGGDGYTYVDLAMAMMADKKPDNEETRKRFEEMCPTLVAISKAVNETPQIKEYLAKRPVTEF